MAVKEKIVTGLSGGVDSAVAAALLRDAGHRVEGLFMKNWEEDDTAEHCTAAEDLADARSVADRLGIPLHTVNFSAEYWERVFTYFLQEYEVGRTPNPDILCNREVKFRAFLEHALERGADAIATGHYARRIVRDGRYLLLKGLDSNKDQSYFLYMLNQHQLAHARFPLGEMEKSQVRRLAAEHGLPNHAKRDSTGICFIGARNFRDFLRRFLPARPGEIRTPDDQVVGHHDGLMYYTLGQRQGLGIGGVPGAVEAPWYVVEKDLRLNVLRVAQQHDHPWLMSRGLESAPPHWIQGTPPRLPLRCTAKTRYRQSDQPCRIEAAGEGLRVYFDTPQWAVTPGQSVVFYAGAECLGGAIIEHPLQNSDPVTP